jgi:hypothetical protein
MAGTWRKSIRWKSRLPTRTVGSKLPAACNAANNWPVDESVPDKVPCPLPLRLFLAAQFDGKAFDLPICDWCYVPLRSGKVDRKVVVLQKFNIVAICIMLCFY